MKRFLKNTRLHFLLLAASLFAVSTILGLSAYLADQRSFTSDFRTASNDDLGFDFTGDKVFDKLLTPGVPLEMKVGVKVGGPNSLYAFIDIKRSQYLSLEGFNFDDWHPLNEDDDCTIYYYGTESEDGKGKELKPLDKTKDSESLIFSGVSLPTDTQTDEVFDLKITGYAIQADLADEPDISPSVVFELRNRITNLRPHHNGGKD